MNQKQNQKYWPNHSHLCVLFCPFCVCSLTQNDKVIFNPCPNRMWSYKFSSKCELGEEAVLLLWGPPPHFNRCFSAGPLESCKLKLSDTCCTTSKCWKETWIKVWGNKCVVMGMKVCSILYVKRMRYGLGLTPGIKPCGYHCMKKQNWASFHTDSLC